MNNQHDYSVLGIFPTHIVVDFETIPCWKIFLSKNSNNYVVDLYVIEGRCPSGWTMATWGMNVFSEYSKKLPKGLLKPKEDIRISYTESTDCKNKVFSCIYIGNDSWYPSGSITIQRNLFH